ncbi:MAG: helix-turn-helix transcriptional regulator [Ruminococcaceae bacterium]|nr:helix-turn-helix transcriptional regulator [Oscillospiraceae bacterium]
MNYFDYLNLAKQKYKIILDKHPEIEGLSARELEVFEQLLSAKSLQEIANELFITYSSVHFHCKNVYRKLGVANRKEILIKYKDI